tara:strand:- start:414 stop:1559 length:1146 start_codon:yes stop_codon:yes gene_type:complete
MDDTSPAYDGPMTINTIIAKKHIGSLTNNKAAEPERYVPIFRGISDVPVKGDSVLLLSNTAGENYFIGPLNSLNNPNFNIDPLNKRYTGGDGSTRMSTREKFNVPPNYTISQVGRLQTPYNEALDNRRQKRKGEDGSIARTESYGDMILEGRFGNSVRLGYNDNSPKIIISNGRNGRLPVETLYDGSIFTMTTHGSLKKHFHDFSLSSDVADGNSRLVGGGNVDTAEQSFNYDFGDDDSGTPILRNQVFMSSDKITFNSRLDNVTMSAFKNVDVGAGNNLTINTKNFTSIESSNIYLGKQAQEQKEPIVLGSQLKEFLIKFLDTMGKATAMVQGAPVPLTDEKGVAGKPLKTYIEDLINELESPTFLSEYHFIEDNGQKAD